MLGQIIIKIIEITNSIRIIEKYFFLISINIYSFLYIITIDEINITILKNIILIQSIKIIISKFKLVKEIIIHSMMMVFLVNNNVILKIIEEILNKNNIKEYKKLIIV